MGAIEVNLNPEQINKLVADTILESALGEQMRNAINEQVKKLSQSYDNPFQNVIARYVNTELENIIKTQYAEYFETEIKKHITGEVLEKIITKAIKNLKYD